MKATASIPAAIYCRSSKDKAEIGLDTQREELRAYAEANGLRVVKEFKDMEISGSLDEVSRPGLRNLLSEMRATDRPWNVLLAVDTSRIARDFPLAIAVQRECDKYGVELRYSKIAVDAKNAAGEMFLTMDRAVSQYHSRISAEKGRAGLLTNIGLGHRAGGRAPIGYKLERTATGGMRGGMPVFKSKLVLDPRLAKKVQTFLRARVEGVARHTAAKAARLGDKTQGSLIAIERNALTYAGHTIWNQRKKHRPTKDDPRKTMLWRPRAEWIISEKPTHEALITRAEAEKILGAVDTQNPKPARTLREPDKYLLTGLLFAPDGTPWQGDGKHYRLGRKGKRISREPVDDMVLQQVRREIKDKKLVGKMVQAAHDMADSIDTSPEPLIQALRKVEQKISGLVDLVAETQNRALIAKLDELEAERTRLQEERASAAERAKLKSGLRSLRTQDVAAMLEFAAAPLEGQDVDVPYLRKTLAALVSRVELDPATRTARAQYRVGISGAKLASPRGFEPRLPP